MRTIKIKPFISFCHVCAKSFSKSADLKQHLSKVHKEGPLRCDHCSHGFFTVHRLKHHQTYVCKSKNPKQLESHISDQEDDSTPLTIKIKKCSDCKKLYQPNVFADHACPSKSSSSNSNSNSQQSVVIQAQPMDSSGDKIESFMPQEEMHAVEPEQSELQQMLEDPNSVQDSAQGGKSKAVLKAVFDLSDDSQDEESDSDSTQEIGKKGKLRKPISKNMCDVLVDGKPCGRNFDSLRDLRNHMSQKHPDKVPFKCSGWEKVCKSGFFSESGLRRHEKDCAFTLSEKEDFICGNCGDQCYSQKEFNKHKKVCYGRGQKALVKIKNDSANHSAMLSFDPANSSEQLFQDTEIYKMPQMAPEILKDLDSSSDQEQSKFQPDSALSVGQNNGLQNFNGAENGVQAPFMNEDHDDRQLSAILNSDKAMPLVHDDEMNLLNDFGHTSQPSMQGLNHDQTVELSNHMMSQAAAGNNGFAPQFNNKQPAIQDDYGLFSNDDQQKIDEATQQLIERAIKRKPQGEPELGDRDQAKKRKL